MMTKFLLKFVLLSLTIFIEIVFPKPVSVFNKKVGQLVTSSLLTWEPFNKNNLRQLEYAVVGGEFLEKYPAYICRSSINSIAITGYVQKRSDESHVCIISQHEQIKTKGEFEILTNKGNGTKIEWTPWDKSGVVNKHMDGFVSTVNGGLLTEVYYIARHKRNQSIEHHKIDHAIGWYDPNEGLFGKIHATVASSEQTFDSGEILTTFEPIKYELHDMKFRSIKLKETKNRILLGQTMMKNEEDKPTEANAIIGYEYNATRNLGHHDGIARSINTTVYVNKKEVYSFFWGIQQDTKVVNTKGVGTVLQPGTALNVTLWGNYTTKEGPYDAQLVIHWADGSKSNKRRITVNNGLDANLEDQLEIEYSEVFWIHNNEVVPTTTRRTNTTSSTLSSIHKSIFSTSMSSNTIEKITEKNKPNNIAEINDAADDDDDDENEVDGTNNSSKIHITSFILALTIMNLIHLITAH